MDDNQHRPSEQDAPEASDRVPAEHVDPAAPGPKQPQPSEGAAADDDFEPL